MITRKEWQTHKKRLGDELLSPKKKTNVGPNLDIFHSKNASLKEKQAALKLISAGLELYEAANKSSSEVKKLITGLKKQCQHSSQQLTEQATVEDKYLDSVEARMKEVDANTKKFIKAIAIWKKHTAELNKAGDKSLTNLLGADQAKNECGEIADVCNGPMMALAHDIQKQLPNIKLKGKRAKDVLKRAQKILKNAVLTDKFHREEIWNKK